MDIAEKAKKIQKRVIEMEERKKYLKEEVFRSIPKDITGRPLFPAEIKQIAGRAGRFGRYEKGYYNAEFGSFRVREKMEREVLALK